MSFLKKLFNFFIKKSQQPNDVPIQNSAEKKPFILSSKDIKAIAGDDLMATQLDLARAYIEIGKKSLARKMLQHVIEHGDAEQQTQANILLEKIPIKKLTELAGE